MTFLDYILILGSLGIALAFVVFIVGRIRRRAFEKARAELLYRANLTCEVWVCRYCGFKSLMKNEECHGCGAPRPEEYVSMTIKEKEYAAQLQHRPTKP